MEAGGGQLARAIVLGPLESSGLIMSSAAGPSLPLRAKPLFAHPTDPRPYSSPPPSSSPSLPSSPPSFPSISLQSPFFHHSLLSHVFFYFPQALDSRLARMGVINGGTGRGGAGARQGRGHANSLSLGPHTNCPSLKLPGARTELTQGETGHNFDLRCHREGVPTRFSIRSPALNIETSLAPVMGKVTHPTEVR